jgi:hypothetical protein
MSGASTTPTAPAAGEPRELPPNASTVGVYRVKVERKTGEDGRSRKREKLERCYGDVGDDGARVDTWDAATFTTRFILDAFGPGEYRCTFFDPTGKPCGRSRLLSIADPKRRAPTAQKKAPEVAALARVRGGAAVGVARLEGASESGSVMPGSFAEVMQLMALMDQRAQSVAERERESARALARMQIEASSQQTSMIVNMFSTLAAALAQPRGQDGSATLGQQLELHAKRLELEMQRQMIQLRGELDLTDDDDDDRYSGDMWGEAKQEIGGAAAAGIRGVTEAAKTLANAKLAEVQEKSMRAQEQRAGAQRSGVAVRRRPPQVQAPQPDERDDDEGEGDVDDDDFADLVALADQ